ncbi:MAG: hypothetical protein RR572_08815, partial [Raoultibacter sp.]
MNSREAYDGKHFSLDDLLGAAQSVADESSAAAAKKSSSEPSLPVPPVPQDVVAVEVLATLPVIPALFAPSRTDDEPITLPEE